MMRHRMFASSGHTSQVKKLAKDVGKVSAELKQVPEEFNKGMEIGQEELSKKKIEGPKTDEPPAAPPPAA